MSNKNCRAERIDFDRTQDRAGDRTVDQNQASRNKFCAAILTDEPHAVHERVRRVIQNLKTDESDLIESIQDIERARVHEAFGKTLHDYVVDVHGLSSATAWMHIRVARMAKKISALSVALKSQKLTVSHCTRFVSVLTLENADELIEFASTHTYQETSREVARRNPKPGFKDSYKDLSEDLVEIRATLSRATFDKLQRVQSLEAQKQNIDPGFAASIDAALDEYIFDHDPVEKARRAAARASEREAAKNIRREGPSSKGAANSYDRGVATNTDFQSNVPADEPPLISPQSLCVHRVKKGRIPLTAAQTQSVYLRDAGVCADLDMNGKKCGSDRWVDIHHVVAVADGGGNELENLITLCRHHHRLTHRAQLRGP